MSNFYAPFNAVFAPSNSRPQMSEQDFRDDVYRARAHMRFHSVTTHQGSGVATFTEISHPNIKRLFVRLFSRRVGLKVSDCPIVWTPDFAKVDGGTDFGALKISVVAPIRRTSWAHLVRDDGLQIGVVGFHTDPGGYADHPSYAQRIRRRLIQRRWKRHIARIEYRIALLKKAGCDVVVPMGDINHPGSVGFLGVERLSGPGLGYVGVSGATASNGKTYRQHADHDGYAVTLTPAPKRR